MNGNHVFTARREYSGAFSLLKIAIHRLVEGRSSVELLGLQWQADRSKMYSVPPQWYGMRHQFGSGAERSPEYSEEALKLLRRLVKNDQYSVGIDKVLSRLYKFARQAVYDSRQGRLVTADALLPSEYQRFVPKYLYLRWPSVITDCVARNESEAQGMIAANLVSRGHHDRYVEFHIAGRPVVVANNSQEPRWQDIDELLVGVV